MIQATLDKCLDAYLQHCKTSTWLTDESYKFFFANWLSRHANLNTQPPERILEHCKQALKEKYNLPGEKTITGVNFLFRAAKDMGQSLTLSDVQLMKSLSENGIPDPEFFKGMQITYPGLSGWIGTLDPRNFVPVGTTDFAKSIPIIFELTDFPQTGYGYFVEAQRYIQQTKEYLKEKNAEQLFLPRINEYRQVKEFNEPRRRYTELEWNWLAQDFHLFIHRVYLKLWEPKAAPTNPQPSTTAATPASTQSGPGPDTAPNPEPEPETPSDPPTMAPTWSPYELQPIQPADTINDRENRGLTFTPDHYLEKYKNQVEKGTRCEILVRDKEIERLIASGRPDLVKEVQIVSANPDYGYDIESREADGTPMQIEVKGIPSDTPKSFYISAHELEKSARLSNYYIYCVYEGDGEPKVYPLKKPNLHDPTYFIKDALTYRITFK